MKRLATLLVAAGGLALMLVTFTPNSSAVWVSLPVMPLANSARASHTLHLCCSCRPFDRVVDFLGDRTLDSWPGSDKPFMALPEDDLQALSNLSNARHKAEDTTP